MENIPDDRYICKWCWHWNAMKKLQEQQFVH